MGKRNSSVELLSGVQDMKDERNSNLALRFATVKTRIAPQVTGKELMQLRGRLHVSQAVFARYLRTTVRTVERWEQGKARPNAQAALLIKLIEKYPETIAHLATL